jgi:hypothetical protein
MSSMLLACYCFLRFSSPSSARRCTDGSDPCFASASSLFSTSRIAQSLTLYKALFSGKVHRKIVESASLLPSTVPCGPAASRNQRYFFLLGRTTTIARFNIKKPKSGVTRFQVPSRRDCSTRRRPPTLIFLSTTQQETATNRQITAHLVAGHQLGAGARPWQTVATSCPLQRALGNHKHRHDNDLERRADNGRRDPCPPRLPQLDCLRNLVSIRVTFMRSKGIAVRLACHRYMERPMQWQVQKALAGPVSICSS